jgi:hypothetical protein
MSQKAKALLIIIVFLAIIILPVCYGIIKEKMAAKAEKAAVHKP